MTFEELLARVMTQVEPLLPYMLAVALVTAAALPVLLGLARGLWVDRKRFAWMGLFLGLRRGESIRLACAWIKLLLLWAYLVGFQKLTVPHHLLFLVPGVLYSLSAHEVARIPGRLLWLALEAVGLLSCNLICGYIRDMAPGVAFLVVYILMALFVALFGCYLFLTELNDISAGRRADLAYDRYTGPDQGAGADGT